MSCYSINTQNGSATRLNEYQFDFEGGTPISPQELLRKNPEIIINFPELEIVGSDILLAMNEYPTGRGVIDILLVSSNADIIIECFRRVTYRFPQVSCHTVLPSIHTGTRHLERGNRQ